MKTKQLVIAGAVIGVAAFLYMKSKKKQGEVTDSAQKPSDMGKAKIGDEEPAQKTNGVGASKPQSNVGKTKEGTSIPRFSNKADADRYLANQNRQTPQAKSTEEEDSIMDEAYNEAKNTIPMKSGSLSSKRQYASDIKRFVFSRVTSSIRDKERREYAWGRLMSRRKAQMEAQNQAIAAENSEFAFNGHSF